MINNINSIIKKEDVLDDRDEFIKENLNRSIQNIRRICIGIVAISIYFFYADFVLLRNVSNQVFRTTLIYIHVTGFTLSSLFLLFYKFIKKRNDNISLLKFILRGFVIILLLMGSLPSIINQSFTGNIDAYIVVILIASVGFPFEIMFMLVSLVLNHTLFIAGISVFCNNYTTLISKQINSTAMVAAAMIFCYSRYRNRVQEFNSRLQLVKSEYNFKQLFNVNPLPMMITRYEDSGIIMSNDKALAFYGYSREEFNSFFAKDLYVHENDRGSLLSILKNSFEIEGYIVEQRCKSGITKWVVANHKLIEYYGQKCILTSVTDITELKKIENQLSKHASIDPLTGILNRRTGMDLLKNMINTCKVKGTAFVVCFIDIDNLKFVNDNYGHSEGDFLINTICSIIRGNLDISDIFFRYGGDEFIILFPDKSETEVEVIWSNVLDNFKVMNTAGLKTYKYSASHGLFQFSSNSECTVEEILHFADKKMYLEKNRKKL